MTPSKEISADEILKTREFSDFLNSAKSFCSLIEEETSLTGTEFLQTAQTHLIKLYFLGRLLPSIHLQTDKDFETDIDDSTMKSLLQFIGQRVPFSYYWVVLNPVDEKNLAETGTGDLIDDLGDIYNDLKRGLLIFDIEDPAAKENAIWKFKFDFDFHWNEHCIQALSAIHHYLDDKK
jgi:hypothetical protein